MDPRVRTPTEALQREFRAASRLSAARGEVIAARQQGEELQKQIASRRKESASGAELSASLADLARKVADVTGVEDREGFGFYELSLPAKEPSLHKVSAALKALLMILESADAAPTSHPQTPSPTSTAAAPATLAPRTRCGRPTCPPGDTPTPRPPRAPASAGTPQVPPPQRPGLNIVVLDPAHGGTDLGARGTGGIHESDIVLEFAAQVRTALEAQGFQVIQTRQGNANPSFDDRSAMANAQRGAIFVTLHIASTGVTGTARGYVTNSLPLAVDSTGLIPSAL